MDLGLQENETAFKEQCKRCRNYNGVRCTNIFCEFDDFTKSKIITNKIGQKFDMLTVVDYAGYDKKRKVINYLCRCDCGGTKVVQSKCLGTKLKVKSCGCLLKKGHPGAKKDKPEKNKPEKNKPKREKSKVNMELREDVLKANELGISYGKYKAGIRH